MNQTLSSIVCLLLAGVFQSSALEKSSSPEQIQYNRDIRPILAENCLTCHGPDSAARKADLRLDSFKAATALRDDSKPAIVPGKPDESSLIHRIETDDVDDLMPPTKTKKTLKMEEIELLRRWVAAGAQYEDHWSFSPPVRAEFPSVKDEKWIKTPIDAFVLARLEKEGLTPAREADRRSLARRVSLDLTGLPPTPEDVEAFVNDTNPNAYEHFVDKLLASERYGEHRARYWLDAARYADTHGIHFDNFREMWSYRDWVINAFNENKRFDQFTIEQLAGDLLPNATLDQRIATGFNRCNITTSEGGAINEEYLALYARDRTETTSAVWLGLTTGCAACHDHKYDPISQKEFYQLSAYFNNTTQPAMDGNRKDTPPIEIVPAREDRPRWEELPELKSQAKQRIERRRQSALDDYTAWVSKTDPDTILEGIPVDGLQFSAPFKESVQPMTVFVDGYPRDLSLSDKQEGVISDYAFTTSKDVVPTIPEAGNFERDQSFSAGLWVRLHPDDTGGAVFARMDNTKDFRGWDFWFEGGRPGIHMVNKWPEDALKVVSKKGIEANRWSHVFLTYDGSSKAEGIKIYIDGVQQEVDRPADKLENTILTEVPFKVGQRFSSDLLEKATVQDVRLYSRVLKGEEIAALKNKPRLAWLVSKPSDQRSEPEQKALYDGFLNQYDAPFQKASRAMANLESEDREIRQRGTIAHVMHERDGDPTAYLLFRGEYDKRRDKLSAGTPEALPPMKSEFPENRLGFAKWLFQPEHPLTARVTVNRMWQELFGVGIVRTTGDFGISGELPSHPDLLDWLAVEFRETGWDLKKMYKLFVMSATYRQEQKVTPEKLAKDPQNTLFSRGPRFRMDAEMIRDYALACSGILSPKIGGPSVKPYQPSGVWEMVAMLESNTRDYKQDEGEKLYRRSLYTFWKRSAPPASMDIFNAPSRETCTVRRERTNTPLQALATLNDPQFIEAARHLAARTLREGGSSDEDRLEYIAQHLLSRSLRPEEREVVLTILEDLREHYAGAPDDAQSLISVGDSEPDEQLEPVLLATYTMVANQMMNMDEVLNK